MKSYLRYVADEAFGVVCSTNSPCVYDYTGQLAIAGALKDVIVWNIRTGGKIRTLRGDDKEDNSGQVTALTLSQDGAFVAAGYSTGLIRIFKLSNGNLEVTLDGHKSSIECLSYSQDGALLASGSRDTDIIVWDIVSQSGLFRLHGHKDAVTGVSFAESSKVLISTSKDTLMKVWDLDTQHCVQTCVGHRNEIWSVDYNPTSKRIVTGSSDNLLRVWSVNGNDEASEPVEKSLENLVQYLGSITRAIQDRVVMVHYNKQGNLVGVQSAGKTLEIFRVRTIEEMKKKKSRRLRRQREKKKNSTATSTSISGPVEDVEEESEGFDIHDELEQVCVLRCGHKIRSFAFSPDMAKDGKTSVMVSLQNNSLETYTLTPASENIEERATQAHNLTLPGHRSDVRCVVISSDDNLLLTLSSASIKIWNAKSLQCVRTITTEISLAITAVFAPGNMHIIVGDKSGTLLIFEIASGECIFKKENAHDGSLWSIDVRPDGRGIMTGGADHIVHFWEFEMTSNPYNVAASSTATLKLSLAPVRMLKMSDDVLCVKYSHTDDPRKLLVAVALLDCTVKVFYDDSLKFFLSLYGHKLPVMSMDISKDDSLLVTASADKNVKIWGLDFGDCHKSIFAHEESIMGIKFVGKSHYFFTASKDKTISYWDGDHFERILKFENQHFGDVWAVAVSNDGSFVISSSADRSLWRYVRTDDQVFIEEEKEKELEALFESELNQNDSKKEFKIGGGTEDDSADAAVKESASAGKKTVQTVRSGERLMEAIDLAESEITCRAEYEKIVKNKISEANDSGNFQANILLLGYTPLKFVLRAVREIRAQDLEEALLVLPFTYVTKLITFLLQLINHRLEMELSCHCLMLILRIHHTQIVSNGLTLLPELDALWNVLRDQLLHHKNRIGFNLAGLSHMKRALQHQKRGFVEELSSTSTTSKKNKAK